jgi:flagellar hook-associated protein FlgK
MGKVTSTQVPSHASSIAERSKAGDGNPMTLTAPMQRGTRVSSRPPAPQSVQPKINVGAATLVHQLTEVNRRLGSGTTDPNSIAPLESRRNAILGELEQNYSVHVVHRSDGSIRIRTEEGRVLLDSVETHGEHGFIPPLGGGRSSVSAETGFSSTDAAAMYQNVESGESLKSRATLQTPEPSQTVGNLTPVSSVQTVEQKIEIVGRLEASLQNSQQSLQQASNLSGNIQTLISQPSQ